MRRIPSFIRGLGVPVLLFFAASMSCDDTGDNYLKGSVVKNYHIKYNDVRVRLYEGELSVEYTSNATEGNIALGVTINTNLVDLAKGKTYPLMEYGAVYRDNGFGTLPDLDSGDLTLNEYSGKDGGEVSGTFAAKFLTPTGSLQNLRGGFSSDLEVVDDR
jgi:hypothetical protein